MKRLPAVLLVLFALFGAAFALAPKEPVDREISFDPEGLDGGIDLWLEITEQQFSDIRPGAAKRVLWAGAPETQTDLALVYVHGFSASAEEIRPVPDEVALALGANLYFTRLAGHGRGSAAMAEPRAGDWIEDMAEAMEIGRRIGKRVIVIGTSTGGTLAALAATDPALNRDLAGVVLISPNFGVQNPMAAVLGLPFARYWAPLIAGQTQSFTPHNAQQERYWTTSYPSVAAFPMDALVREAQAADFARARVPVLAIWSPDDRVIDPAAIAPVLAAWAGPVTTEERRMTPDDDPMAHVIAGDILSPGQTEAVIDRILTWAAGL
jgi:alpha-beta hydrolase superfamily lysophospholipase